jgi:hypothetical protein
LNVDARIKCYAAQPHKLTYWAPDREGRIMKRTYTPDYVALDRHGRIIVMEVKAQAFAGHSNWTRLQSHIRSAYEEEHGAMFLVFTEEVIRVQPRLANCQIMLGHARNQRDAAADLAIRDVISGITGEVLVAQICVSAAAKAIDEGRSFSALMRLAVQGIVKLDLSKPLSSKTRVVLGDLM